MKEKSKMSFIARKSCGCIKRAIADEPEFKIMIDNQLAEWGRKDYNIDYVSRQYVNDNMKSCSHFSMPL